MINENNLSFDIETDKNEVAEEFMPEFEADGRLTDPVKIKQSIENKEGAWKEKCALSAITGKILCIGYRNQDGGFIHAVNDSMENFPNYANLILMKDETELLEVFWHMYHHRLSGIYLVGFNNHEFDMPFIYQRSLINRVKTGVNPLDRNWNMSIDLRETWWKYQRNKEGNLNDIAKALGIGSKLDGGEISKNFGKFWKENRKLALDNVFEDIRLTYEISKVIL